MYLETKRVIFVFWIFLQVQGTEGKLGKCLFLNCLFIKSTYRSEYLEQTRPPIYLTS